jgi:hypothetical protein
MWYSDYSSKAEERIMCNSEYETGNPVIRSVEQARAAVQQVAKELGVTVEELLDPEGVAQHIEQSPLLEAVLRFGHELWRQKHPKEAVLRDLEYAVEYCDLDDIDEWDETDDQGHIADEIAQACGWDKLTGRRGMDDFIPLVVVMVRVAQRIEERGGSFKKSKARWVWCEAMRVFQEDNSLLEHNSCIPCRTCDQAFEPVIDDALLTLFLAWHESCGLDDFLAIHRCPTCDGTLKAERTVQYEGDFYTPPPGSVADGKEWAERLLEHTSLSPH